MAINRGRIVSAPGAPAVHQPATFTVVPKVTKTSPDEPRVIPRPQPQYGPNVMIATPEDQVPEEEGELIVYENNQGSGNRFAEVWVGVTIDGVLQYVPTDLGEVHYQQNARGERAPA